MTGSDGAVLAHIGNRCVSQQHVIAAPACHPAQMLEPVARGGNLISACRIRLEIQWDAQLRAANLGEYHGLLPALEVIDITAAYRAGAQPAHHAVCRIEGVLAACMRREAAFEQTLDGSISEWRFVVSQQLTHAQRCRIHGHVDESMQVWRAPEIEHCGRPFETKNLVLPAVLYLTVSIVRERQALDPTIVVEALPRV